MQAPGEMLFEAGRRGGEGRYGGAEEEDEAKASRERPRSEQAGADGAFLVPAEMAAPPPLPGVPASSSVPSPFPFVSTPASAPAMNAATTARTGSSTRKARHAAVSPSRAFDEYFEEGERRSKEVDFVPSTAGAKGSGALPPPPKPPPKMGPGTGTGDGAGAGAGAGGPPSGGVGRSASPAVGLDGEGT